MEPEGSLPCSQQRSTCLTFHNKQVFNGEELLAPRPTPKLEDRSTIIWHNNYIYNFYIGSMYDSVSKSFRTGSLERELQMVQLSATKCSCIAILWVSLVSFAAITFCVASQRVFMFVVVDFVIDSVRKLFDTLSYVSSWVTVSLIFK
jgi:hypothetical protein